MPALRPAAVSLSLLVLAAGLLFLGCEATAPTSFEGASHPAVGKSLQVIRLQGLTGDPEPVSAPDIAGKVTLINYWGPWCGYCEVEFPHLVDLVKHFGENPDFKFLSVSCPANPSEGETLADETTDFLARYKADFPTYTDADQVSRKHLIEAGELGEYGFGYPTTLVLDRTGTIRGLWVGYESGYESQMRRVLDQELAKETAPGQ